MAEDLWFRNFVEKWVKLHLLTTSQLIQVMESDWAKARCGENMQAFSGQQHTTVTSAMWDTRHRDIGHHQLGETQTQMLQMASYNLLSSETWIPSGQNFSWVWILHQQALARLWPMEGGGHSGPGCGHINLVKVNEKCDKMRLKLSDHCYAWNWQNFQ